MRTFLAVRAVTLLGILPLLPDCALAEAPPAEKQKIEALIAGVEGLKEATFIRNGSEYSSANAAKFLRGKWSYHTDEIHTSEEFIAKAATVSGTSGKPYLIRFKDGKTVPCGDYLRSALHKLEK